MKNCQKKTLLILGLAAVVAASLCTSNNSRSEISLEPGEKFIYEFSPGEGINHECIHGELFERTFEPTISYKHPDPEVEPPYNSTQRYNSFKKVSMELKEDEQYKGKFVQLNFNEQEFKNCLTGDGLGGDQNE